MPSETLTSLFSDRVARDGDRAAIHIRRGEAFQPRSWNELAADVDRAAAELARLGVRAGDRVAQVSENRYEWIVCDLAVHLACGAHVAVHCTLTGPQIADQIIDSGAKLVIVSGAEQAQKLATVADRLLAGTRYLSHDHVESAIGFQRVERLSDLTAARGGIEEWTLPASFGSARPDTLATILYTSGTTGEPKGVMLSHANLASNALASLAAFELDDADLRLTWLPLSHIFARTCDLYTWLAGTGQLALAQSRETILADCAKLHPTLINGVPYFFEKITRHLHEQGRADQPGALLELLGGRVRLCCAGGAALPDHVARFFERQGVLLVQGYGLTESSPVISTGTPKFHRVGTVGPPISGVEVQIAADGEVLTRGPHVMQGYWNRPGETAEAIDADGWLHTGDLGQLEDGLLRITGRKKELIVTAAGKNIAPVLLEGLLTQDPLIAQAIVIGDGRNYLTALIVPDPGALKAEIINRQIPIASPAEAVVHPQVLALYTQRINERLTGVSRNEQIGKFRLLTRGFTIESGELTPTLKLRRAVILANFAAEIAGMYAETPDLPGEPNACRL